MMTPTLTAARAPERVALGEVLDFMRLLWSLDHGLQTASKRMARQLGFTGPQRLALRLVGRFPGIAPGALAKLLQLHPSTITGVLLRLERRQLIERRAHAHDRRRAHLFLTPAGRRLGRTVPGTVEGTVKALLATVGKRRLAEARAVLTLLAGELLDGAGGR